MLKGLRQIVNAQGRPLRGGPVAGAFGPTWDLPGRTGDAYPPACLEDRIWAGQVRGGRAVG